MKQAVCLTIDKEVLDRAKKIANKQDRSLSSYVNAFLKRVIGKEKNGK